MIIDKELNLLSKEKNELLMLNEQKKITDKEFYEKLIIINGKLHERQKKVIEIGIVQQQQEDVEREKSLKDEMEKMDEMTKNLNYNKKGANKQTSKEDKMSKANKEKKVPKEKKVREESNCSLIAKSLSMKSVKTVDAAVEKVAEQRKVDKEKIKKQVVSIIYNVKKQNGRWSKYTWDEESFMLTLKE